MKINKNFTMRNIAGEYILVPVGEAALDVSGLLITNEVGAFIWEILLEETTEEAILARILEEFEINEETAKADLQEFLTHLQGLNIL